MKTGDGNDNIRRCDFSFADWLRFRPFLALWKQSCLEMADFVHVRKPALNRSDLESAIAAIAGRRALVSVAFNDPTVVQWQITLVRRHVPGVHLIADNSTDDASAKNIEGICRRLGVCYVRLPPAKARHASYSHGHALNWLWRNLLQPAAPEAFGFLDHDLFPTEDDDPFRSLKDQSFYGAVRAYTASRHRPVRWNLWPGFSFFRFDAVSRLPLNFHQDWFFSMDTGGRNWRLLYRNADLSKLHQPPWTSSPIQDDPQVNDISVQWIGSWVHEIGTGSPTDCETRRKFVKSILLPQLQT